MKYYTCNFKDSKGSGWFQFYGLYDWWENTFSEDEKKYILEKFKPMGMSSIDLIKGDFTNYETTQSRLQFLTIFIDYFQNKDDRYIAQEFINKAEDVLNIDTPIIDLHFFYQKKIETNYKKRNEDISYLDTAIETCQEQIAIAPLVAKAMEKDWGLPLPSHVGYKQLVIICTKDKNYTQTIQLCESALLQGWSGDWKKRIKKLKERLS